MLKKAIFRCKFFVKFSVCVTSNDLKLTKIENVQLSIYLSSPHNHNIVNPTHSEDGKNPVSTKTKTIQSV